MRSVRAVLLSAVTAVLLLPVLPAAAQPSPPTSGTFFWANAWAAHHTAARGPSSGAARMRRLVGLVRRAGVDVGVLAEVEHSQIASFRRSAPAYGLLVGGRGTTDAVFWDAAEYQLQDGYRFRGVSYRGRRVPVPVAVLRDRSGGLLAVIAVHNPRDHWRSRALARELKEVRRLRRTYDGVRVFVAGDFNAGSSVACRAHRAALVSAGNRHCRGPAPIDQLLADRAVRIRGYRAMSGRRIASITDHRAVYRARFTVGPTPPGSPRG